ncbi:MAG: hypothetical protein JRJ62_10500 [Deltaproteobacteria bacterium]|nr:hypothetical protein [Deltaproteobacteria bacterium]
MLKFIKKISQKAGSAPGTLVHIGERKIEKPRIRKNGCDYLAYALIDAVIDHYFVILESISATIESLEEELLDEPAPETMQSIHELKRKLIYMRKQVWRVHYQFVILFLTPDT